MSAQDLCVAFLLEQVFIDDELDLLDGSEGTEETTWVEDVQTVHREDNHGTIHSVEVDFSGDDSAVPTVGKLDSSVHGPDVDGEGAESCSNEHHLHILVQNVVAGRWVVVPPLEGLVAEVTEDELDGEDHVDGDGNHLEDDATQHDFSTQFRVLVVTGGGGSNGTTNTLNGEGDHISGKEGDRIWRARRMINPNSETAVL